MKDNLDELCEVLYERRPKAADYLGGSDAQILKDATTEILTLRKENEELKKENDREEKHQKMIAVAEEYLLKLKNELPSTPEEIETLKIELDILMEPFSDDPAYVALLRLERAKAFGAF